MKRLNIKLLLILFGIIVVSIPTAYFVRKFQMARGADSLRLSAEKLWDDGDPVMAFKRYQTYFKYRPEDYDVMCELALKRLEYAQRPHPEPPDAVAALSISEHVLRFRPDHEELRRELIDFYLLARRVVDSTKHIEYLQDKGVVDAELDVTLARLYWEAGETESAIGGLSELLGYEVETGIFNSEKARDSSVAEAYILLARILFAQDMVVNQDKAIGVVDSMVEINPESWEAYLLRSRYIDALDEKKESQNDQIKADVQRAIELGPDEAEVLITAANVAIHDRDFDKAKGFLDRGIELFPDKDSFWYKYAEFHERQRQYTEALERIEEGIEQVPDSHALLWKRVELYLAMSDVEKIKDAKRELEGKFNTVWLDYLDGRIAFIVGDWKTAVNVFTDVRASLIQLQPGIGVRVDLDLGRCYLNLNQPDNAITAYNRCIQSTPGLMQAMLGLSRAYERIGQVDKAVAWMEDVYTALIEESPTPNPEILMGLLQLHLTKQGRVSESKRDWTRCDSLFEEVRKHTSIPALTKAHVGTKLFLLQGKKELAKTVIEKANERHPGELVFWLYRVDLSNADEDWENTAQILDEMDQQFGETQPSMIRVLKATLITRQGGPEVLSKLKALEEGIESWELSSKIHLWRGLAEYYRQLNDVHSTRRLLKQVADVAQDDVDIQLQLFELAKAIGDVKTIESSLEKISSLAGTDDSATLFSKASYVVWQVRTNKAPVTDLKTARSLLQEARKTRPDWPELIRLEGDIALGEEDVDTAIRLYERALELGRNDPQLVRVLNNLLKAVGREGHSGPQLDEEQKTTNEKIVDLMEDVRSGREVGMERLDSVIPPDTDNVTFLIQRGEILDGMGQTSEAEKTLKRAVVKKIRDPNPWYSLLRFMLRHKRHAAAEAVVREAQLHFSQAIVPKTIGYSYELLATVNPASRIASVNAFRQAERFYLMAYEMDPEDKPLLRTLATFYMRVNRQTEAKRYLEKILEGEIAHSSRIHRDVAWARRAYGKILSGTGSYQDYLESLRMIRENVPEDGRMRTEDRLLTAEISLMRGDAPSIQYAIEILSKSQQRVGQLSVAERLILAQLYDKNVQWTEAVSTMNELLAENPDNQNYIGVFVEMLLSHKDSATALRWIPKLQENSPLRIRAEVTLDVLNRRPDQALEKVKRLLGADPKEIPVSQNDLVRNVAVFLETLSRNEGAEMLGEYAERLMRFYVQREPNQLLRLAAFLGRQKGLDKLEQAFAECEKAINQPGFAVTHITQIGVATLRQHRTELQASGNANDYYVRVEQWLDQASSRFPESKTLLIQQAEFEDLRGDRDKVVDLYRLYLSRPDLDERQRAIVQNNLAYYLAVYHGQDSAKAQEAKDMVEKSIEVLGMTSDLLDTRGWANVALGDYPGAVRDFQTAIVGGKSAVKFLHLAYGNFLDHNFSASQEALEDAQELGLEMTDLSDHEQKIYREMLDQRQSRIILPNSRRLPAHVDV